MSQAGEIDVTGTHPEIPTEFVEDVGTAVPIANILEILGTYVNAHNVPIQTLGSGNTVTITTQLASANGTSVVTKAGIASFDSAVFTVDANGFVSLVGSSAAIEKVNLQTGTTPIVPSAGAINLNGAVVAAGTNPIRTDGTGPNTAAVEVQISQAIAATDATKIGLSAFDSSVFSVDANGFVTLTAGNHDYHDSIYIVGQNLLNGANYTDLATAYADAVLAGVGATIMLQPGVYTLASPLQIRSGINLFAQNSQIASGPVAIKGKLYDNGVGASCAFNGITFITDSDYSLALTASSVTTFYNCWFRGTNNTIFNLSAGTLKLISCQTNLETTGISVYNNTGGTIFFQYCILGNDGLSTTTGTHSSGSATFRYCTITIPLATSGTGYVSVKYSQFGTIVTPYINQTWLTTSGTVISYLLDCSLYSGTATAVSIGAGTTVEMYNCIINSSNASAISGAGSIKYGDLDFTGSSSVNSVTTQITTVDSNDALNVVSPGAYPYTASAQDAYISVNTSSAKTVNLPSSPVSGQTHIIADITGLAFTNNITVSGNGKTIDGSASYTINFNYGCVKFIYNGTEWNVSSASNARDYHDSIYIVGSNASANYTTIASAYAAAVASGVPSTVFIQPGTYTENLTGSANVNLCAHVCDAYTPNVTIIGKLSFASAGTLSISGINLQTNSDYCLSITGSAASIVNLRSCKITAANNTAINFTTANASAALNLNYCEGDISTTGIALFSSSSTGTFRIFNSIFLNSGGSSTANTCSDGNLFVRSSSFNNPWNVSGSCVLQAFSNSIVTTNNENATCMTLGGVTGTSVTNSVFNSGSASAISISSSYSLTNCNIASSNTNAITGAGTLLYAGLAFYSTSSTINTTIQTPQVYSNDALKVVSPAGSYTIVPQDAVILVDTTAARTITMPASPTTGEKHIIKDATGGAAAFNITVAGNGHNIDGATSFTMSANWQSVTLVYSGSQWLII